MQPNQNTKRKIQHCIAGIDQKIATLLDQIYGHPKFQSLESRWRGIQYLLGHSRGKDKVKIRVLDISWAEICRDLEKAIDFDQSLLFHFIYSDAYGTAGGEPFGVIMIDHYVTLRSRDGRTSGDLNALKGLAQVSAAAFTPMVLSPSPELFGINDFSELGSSIDLERMFQSPEYMAWQSFRKGEDTRFIALTLPQMLMRLPYSTTEKNPNKAQRTGQPADGLNYTEAWNRKTGIKPLWGNACFALGTVLIREFQRVGWFSHIAGVLCDNPNGGRVDPPATIFSKLDRSPIKTKPQTNIVITEKQERELNQLGFMSLCQMYDAQDCAFYSTSTLHKAKTYQDDASTRNAKVSSTLQHILCGSRFAHYIKIMIRDKVGSFFSALECQSYLQRWLHQYTSANEDLDWQAQARYPLREADVKVREVPGKVGFYLSEIRLRPQYQIDQLVSELRLITELSNHSVGS